MTSSAPPLALPGPLSLTPGTAPPSETRVRELAHEFESMLLLQMLRQMRQSMTMFGGDGEADGGLGKDTLTDTMDAEVARQLSLAGGLGIADLIVSAFERREEDGAVASGAPREPVALTDRAAAPSHDLSVTRPQGSGRTAAQPAAGQVVSAGVPAAVGHPTTKDRGGVLLPMNGPVSSRFGWRVDPLGNGTRFHRGIDLKAAYGRPVPAAAAGRVVFAGEQGSYGTTVVVEHGPGLQTRYAHLSASLVREGQTVARGDTIGRVGSSGRSTGPHLHFEVVKDGRRIDPEQAAAQYARASLKEPGPGADSLMGGASLERATEE